MKKRIGMVISIIIIYIISCVVTMGEPNKNVYSRENPYYILVNKQKGLEKDYKPSNLTIPNVKFLEKGIVEKKFMINTAADHLKLMFQDAAQEKIHLVAVSGYRSYHRQSVIYNTYIRKYGQAYTDRMSAKPGHSEHQSGLAMDVSAKSVGYSLTQRFGGTKEGKWVAENAHLYGFIIRYPKDKEHLTGYMYEPWHLRYVGKELAEYLYINQLILEEMESFFKEAETLNKIIEDPIVPEVFNSIQPDEADSIKEEIVDNELLEEKNMENNNKNEKN